MGSANALCALQRGEVHMAGLHLVDMKSGQSNVPYLKRHARNQNFIGVHFASWVQGLTRSIRKSEADPYGSGFD